MNFRKLLVLALLINVVSSFAQSSTTEIKTKSGLHYITASADFPVFGTYQFEGKEPIVQLNANGTGIYQLHDQPKKPMIWGLECTAKGPLKLIKGFNSAAYTLWYKFTGNTEDGTEPEWTSVEYTLHFNTQKMYIQGERVKDFGDTAKK